MNPLQTKLNAMTSGELYEIAMQMTKRVGEEADIVMMNILEALESKVSEEKFTELADNIYAATVWG